MIIGSYNRIVIILVAVFGLLMTGVASSDQHMNKTEVKAGEKLPAVRIEPVKYIAKGNRDPFFSIITLAKQKMDVQRKTTNPVENYDVNDFRLLGIIFDGKDYYASVVLPDRKAYTLKKGMKIGLYGGKIDQITSDKIIVKEFIIDFMGKTNPKYTEIKLRE